MEPSDGGKGRRKAKMASRNRRSHEGTDPELEREETLEGVELLLCLYVVLGVPVLLLFLFRGWTDSFTDGEVFIFTIAILLGVLVEASMWFARFWKNQDLADSRAGIALFALL